MNHKKLLCLILLAVVPGCISGKNPALERLKGACMVYKQTYYKEGNIRERRTFVSDPSGKYVSDTFDREGAPQKHELQKYEQVDANTVRLSYHDDRDKLLRFVIQRYAPGTERILKREVHDPKGTLVSTTDYAYNKDGGILRQEGRDAAGKLNGVAYDFDEKGNVTMASYYTAGNLRYTTKIEYDAIGNVIKRSQNGPGGELKNYRQFTYDANNNLTVQGEYNAAGALQWRIVSDFNAKGLRTKISFYGDSDGALAPDKLRFYRVFEFDGADNLAKVVTYNAENRKIGSGTYEYDKEGNKKKQTFFNDKDELIVYSTYSYRYY